MITLANRLLKCSAPAVVATGPRLIGAVTASYLNIQAFDSPAEALDVLSIAEVGDLVVFACTADSGAYMGNISVVGMPMTVIFDDSPSSAPSSFSGFRVVEAGDTNPYLSGVAQYMNATSVVAAVFREVVGTIGASSSQSSTAGMPAPPSLTSTDLLRVIIGHLDDDPIAMTAPAGWTLAGTASSDPGTSNYSATAIAYLFDGTGTLSPSSFGGPGNDAWRASHTAFL
jgi:hypothetical protein